MTDPRSVVHVPAGSSAGSGDPADMSPAMFINMVIFTAA